MDDTSCAIEKATAALSNAKTLLAVSPPGGQDATSEGIASLS
jgi:hypothetical protein